MHNRTTILRSWSKLIVNAVEIERDPILIIACIQRKCIIWDKKSITSKWDGLVKLEYVDDNSW